MVSLLQRACVGLDQASGPSLGNPVESQTLSMGMGLVATLLSGPQVVTAENYTYYFMHILDPLCERMAIAHCYLI